MIRPECHKCGKEMTKMRSSKAGTVIDWACIAKRKGNMKKYCAVRRVKYSEPVAQKIAGLKSRSLPVKTKRFVVTCAQNLTQVNDTFLQCLIQYCDHNNAELIVIPMRYMNPSLYVAGDRVKDQDVWDSRVRPYLYDKRKKLNNNLCLLADLKISPTAETPLSGLEGFTEHESGIIGHTKLQLRTIPTVSYKLPKLLVTTGAVTVKNYSDSKAGKKGEFHHVFGACNVELDTGGKFHIRQINYDKRTEGFIDLDKQYFANRVEKAPPAHALVLGDTHRVHQCRIVETATFGKGGLCDLLSPKALVFHDLHDGFAENPHHDTNPFIKHVKNATAMDDIEKELRGDAEWLAERAKKHKVYVVASNHDNFLYRWVQRTDWKKDLLNAEFYLQTALSMVRGSKVDGSGAAIPDPWILWIKKLLPKNANVHLLSRTEGLRIADVELSLHGDIGPNGARGSIRSIKKIGAKTIIGHSHTPGIEAGCYQTGTSSKLHLEYNLGPSSWLNTHVVIYANGKRSLINIINGKWRTHGTR